VVVGSGGEVVEAGGAVVVEIGCASAVELVVVAVGCGGAVAVVVPEHAAPSSVTTRAAVVNPGLMLIGRQ
jgi:hypothetical protein